MKILPKATDPSKLETDILIAFCWENEVNTSLPDFPQAFLNEIKEDQKREEFEGKEEQILSVSGKNFISSYKLLLVGLGKKENFNIYNLYKFIAMGVGKARQSKPAKVAILPSDFWMKKFSVSKVAQIIAEATILSSYQFVKYKSEDEKQKIKQIDELILSLAANKISAGEEGIRRAQITAGAVTYARDLINEPPEITSPSYLAEKALEIASESGGKVKVKIFEQDEIAKLGMYSFLGVARGSDKPPKFIHLSYKPSGFDKKLVLIGKGITFDTGGLSLKSAATMETMKLDMSGAGAVLSVFKALPSLKPKVAVVGLIAACENMPSGRALKPGDILRALNGKTIEVLNTDAEGRLTLADALAFANAKEKPDQIIDLATLTGACMVALGEEIAGLWSNNDALRNAIYKSAETCGEKVWPMPLEKEYRNLIKSNIADIKNTQTGKYGGAITAALFLSEFVKDTAWVHLDIAGPAFAEKDTPLTSFGGTGFGIRLLLEYLTTI